MSTQIDITENGTTTLATAGKYCDRNIDVNVNVPSYDDELVDVSITEFVNSTVESIGVYGLGYKGKLKKIDVSNVKSIGQNAFYNNRVLDTLIIRTPEVCVLTTTTGVFKNTKIESGTGYIYVPDDLVESYKAATNWATYASQIKSISELGE